MYTRDRVFIRAMSAKVPPEEKRTQRIVVPANGREMRDAARLGSLQRAPVAHVVRRLIERELRKETARKTKAA